MNSLLELSNKNMETARKVIEETNVIGIWENYGATVNLIGSLKSGLLMKNRDIDFHIYTDKLDIQKSFAAISQMASNPRFLHIEYRNLIDTDEKCIEWHAIYRYNENEKWKIDMIHILRGSKYDGYMEKVTDRIIERLTPETKQAILSIKNELPEDSGVMGIEVYKAVMADGIRHYRDFIKWRNRQPLSAVLEWMP